MRKIKFKTIFNVFFLMVFSNQALAKDAIGDETLEKILQQMTHEEKIDFIGGYKNFNVRGIERLGIPEIHIADGPVGIRNYGPSTAYPASVNLAATWDKSLAYATGKSLGLEARAKNIHLVLGPGVNLSRLPITGRNFEYMGEDPHLAGQLAKHYILGMQDQGVMADIKHFAANNQEFDRNNVSSDVDERTLHELYLPAFKTAVQEAKVATVMTGYNPVNGIHMSQHDYLNNKVLKKMWGFEGFTISDWASTYDGVAAANGGLDLEMPAGDFMNRKNLLPAIKEGKVLQSTIDEKVRRILKTYDRFGYFKNADLRKDFVLDADYVRKVALDSARGGITLLKNENNILPLNTKKIKTIAIIGPNAERVISGGGGSSFTKPLHSLSFLDAVKKQLPADVKVIHEPGVFVGAPFPAGIWDDFPFYIYKNGKKVQGANAEFYLGKNLEGKKIHERVYDRVKLEDGQLWDNPGVPKSQFSTRFTSYFTPEKSGYYSLAGKGDDGYRILLDDVEVVNVWRNQGPTDGKADIFMNAKQEYKVVTEYYNDGAGAVIYQGIKEINLDVLPTEMGGYAIKAAKEADMVLIAAGFDMTTEGESFDRTFELPYKQAELIQSIAKVNKNIVVILNSGGNLEMSSWIDGVQGLLMAWYPGQEGNLAVSEILFGKTNPSGKLPVSFEKNIQDNPSYPHYFDHDKNFAVNYGEGLFMGYRYWDKSNKKPRYPFGYGLSYTQFTISNVQLDKNRYKPSDRVKISVDVKNTGAVHGAEVVQIYVSDLQSSISRPLKELKGFEKVFLAPGEKTKLVIELASDVFSFYDPQLHDWKFESGEFEILVGNSSDNIVGKRRLTLLAH